MALFTDASANPDSLIGFGAYLIIPEIELTAVSDAMIKSKIQLKKFEQTSSTKLELQTLLWALEQVEKNNLFDNLAIYTDSQNIVGLPGRKTKLENNNFKSSGKNKELNNADLYRRFFDYHNRFKFELIKLKGHSTQSSKDIYHRIFAYVDRGSRMALRQNLLEL